MSVFSHSNQGAMKKYLVLDLEEDERKLRNKLPDFWKKVACANEKPKKREGKPCLPVELNNVGASHVDPTSEPKEPKMSHQEDDFFSELFENPPKKTPQEKKPSPDESLGTDPVPQRTTSSGSSSVPPIVPKPEDVVHASQVTATRDPQSVVRKLVDVVQEPKGDVRESKPWGTDLADGLSNFDMDGFRKAFDHACLNLANVDRTLDLKRAKKTLDEYRVSLDLDNSDRLGSLGDKMAQIQAHMDSLRVPLAKLTDWGNELEKSWKYIESVGLLYSSASSREKRDAEVKLALGAFWLEYSEVTGLRDSYQEQLEALEFQWNTLSRLITHDMSVRNTIRSISAGTLTEPEKAAIAEEVAKQIAAKLGPEEKSLPSIPEVAKAGPVAPKTEATERPLPSIFDTGPSSDPLNFANLDEFPKNATEISKKKKTKGELDWKDF